MGKVNTKNDNFDKGLKGEAKAFDQQILERIKHGHVPDLRHTKKTKWFYNNVWSDPALIKLSYIENINFFLKHLNKGSKILEVGCGPGHNSLELARHGHHVTAVDLSPLCIKLAKETLAKNKYQEGFGSLNYYAGNFSDLNISGGPFDAVLCFGSLSHFPNLDKDLDRMSNFLVPSGKMLVWDTTVDLYSKKDAGIMYLIRALLGSTGHYYKKETLPSNEKELAQKINSVYNELMYIDEKGSNVQSPNDNCNSYKGMMAALDARFKKIAFTPEACLYRNTIGGIRSKKQKDKIAMAHFIKMIDQSFIESGLLCPAFFYYVGKKR